MRPVLLLGALALGQIEHESDALVSLFFEGCHADQHGHAGTVFPEVLLFERLQTPGPPVFSDPLCLAVKQVGGRYIRPVHAACAEVLTLVSDDAKEGVIGLKDATVEMPEKYPDNIGVEQEGVQQLLARQGLRHRDHRGEVEVFATADT